MVRQLRVQKRNLQKRFSAYNKYTDNIRGTNAVRNVVVLLVAVALILGAIYFGTLIASRNATLDERIDAPKPIATHTLNKSFDFPLRTDEGEEVSKIKYIIESANLQDAFIYKGKLAKAVKGRTFLILNLKITNPYTQTVEINTKDYVRVSLNNSRELMAPEIHNDPVQIQANSTKYTRIGLPINDTDTNITLFVGELSGEKEQVKLTLKR